MSTQSLPFESINLESIALQPTQSVPFTDTSDDGLDPTDFLSQSQANFASSKVHVPGIDAQQEPTIDDATDLPRTPLANYLEGVTPSLSTSLNLSASHDSFHFSLGSLRDLSQADVTRLNGQHNSPLEHLLKRRESLEMDMTHALRFHEKYQALGDDCSGARTTILKLFAMLSENALLLQEVYAREAVRTGHALNSFQAWDQKRTKVLRRIRRIRSENNGYGAKLSELLTKRSQIDQEVAALEARLEGLRANKLAIDVEVGETASVLESKLARFVEMFRNLEKTGADAALNYLGPDVPLLRYESVGSFFLSSTQKHTEMKKSLERQDVSKNVETCIPVSSLGAMGAEVFEIPAESGFQAAGENLSFSDRENSAYECGFARGSQQLDALKRKLSMLLRTVAPLRSPQGSAFFEKMEDSSNTINKMLDILPIVDFLTSKSNALGDLATHASKASEIYHKDGIICAEVFKYLNAQEELLLRLMITSPSVSKAEEILRQLYYFLKSKLENDIINTASRPEVERDYLRSLTSQEILTVAAALDQLSEKNTYVISLHSSKGLLAKPIEPSGTAEDLLYCISSISSKPDLLNTDALRRTQSSEFPARGSEKDMKND